MTWLIVFDLDGVLLDTSPGITESVKYTVHHLGYNSLSQDELMSFLGPPIQDSFARQFNLDPVDAQNATEIFRKHYINETILNAAPYEGIYHLLKKLRSKNTLTAVATYKREDLAINLLKYYELNKYFDLIHGTTNLNSLSKADIIEKCITESGIERSKTILIGDTSHDANAADSAGINFIGVTYGYGFNSISDIDNYRNIGSANTTNELLELVNLRIS